MASSKKKTWLIQDIAQNKTLIWKLAKNDFKTKYAGSYLGTIWAFIQPVVTVLVYWFVFSVGLRANSDIVDAAGRNVPFVLWLIAGIVPWFFFSEAWSSGSTAMISYTYLVKKVVFQINILPVIKVLSAMFVHAAFLILVIVIYACYGRFPDLYYLQLIYYSFCTCMLVLGLSYICSAVVVFFRDLMQIIAIVLQVGIWMTPIMWSMEGKNLPGAVKLILKLNPMYYITQGYRNVFIYKVNFWETPELTLYFWGLTFLIFAAGTVIFRRLKIHFADVL